MMCNTPKSELFALPGGSNIQNMLLALQDSQNSIHRRDWKHQNSEVVISWLLHVIAGLCSGKIDPVAIAGRSYAHINGFDRIVLYEEKGIGAIRLHIWNDWKTWDSPVESDIHSHFWDFISTVLLGSIEMAFFNEVSGGDGWRKYSYEPSVDDREYILMPRGYTDLREEFRTILSARDTYFLRHDMLHIANPATDDLTATLVLQGPVVCTQNLVFTRKGSVSEKPNVIRKFTIQTLLEKVGIVQHELEKFIHK